MSSFKQSQTWMLFENGEHAGVELSLHASPPDSARPVDAYVVTEHGGFARSARRAAEAVYGWLDQRGLKKEPFVAGFDLSGISSGPITGESGGLAFAVALAGKLLGEGGGIVAATGEITSGHGDGPVGQVRGIEAKINSALQLLPENGVMFYPAANDCEISGALRDSVQQKGVRLQPVSSVAQALDLLFASRINGKKGEIVRGNKLAGKSLFVLAGALLIIALFSSIFFVSYGKRASDFPKQSPVRSDTPVTDVPEAGAEPLNESSAGEQVVRKAVETGDEKMTGETLIKAGYPEPPADNKGFE